MIEYTSTPDYYNDYICHYGVKGMKWHYHKKPKYADDTDYHKKLNSLSVKDYWALVDASHAGKSKGKSSSSSSSKKTGSSKKESSGSKSSSSKTTKESTKSAASSENNVKQTQSAPVRKIIDRTKPTNEVSDVRKDYRVDPRLIEERKRKQARFQNIMELVRRRKLRS